MLQNGDVNGLHELTQSEAFDRLPTGTRHRIENATTTATFESIDVFTDTTCNPIGSDQVVSDAGIDGLADNGGPTLTHALLPGSVAIDAANPAVCPATDQRGVARDAACDVGAFEFVP